ncbi:unnamed protein product [Lactuca saligna]|uniref:15-cis-phytoene synthase n=1 Tax=Lactuca saligna TaxID=75948 RepID=A0AA36E6E5_LACSI|nr:unnamed protein product [Lactuca saligna]
MSRPRRTTQQRSISRWTSQQLTDSFITDRLPVLVGAAGALGAARALGATYCSPYITMDGAYHARPSGQTSALPPTSAFRGRVYLPQDELAQYGLCDDDVYSRRVTDNWREFMKGKINRARFYFNQAEEGASKLDKDNQWSVWSSLVLYQTILDAIEENDYVNHLLFWPLHNFKKYVFTFWLTTVRYNMVEQGLVKEHVDPLLMKSIGWQGGSILALETLKRVVVVGNRAWYALVAQGLRSVIMLCI